MATSEGFARPPATDTTAELARLNAENAALRGRLRRRRVIRQWLGHFLLVLSVVLVIASTVAVWAYRTAFDTDRFMTRVAPVLDEPAVTAAVSTRVSDQVLVALDLETRVANRLEQLDAYVSEALVDAVEIDPARRELLSNIDRPSLAALAPPIASTMEERVVEIVDRLVTSAPFREQLIDLVRQAHEAAVALVRDDMAELPNVYTAGGEVRINLIPVIRNALRLVADDVRGLLPDIQLPDVVSGRVAEGREQLGDSLQARLPDDFGQVTVMSEDTLGAAQEASHRLTQLIWLLVLATGLLIAATIMVSTDRRRRVAQVGVAVVLGLIIGTVLIRRMRASVLEQARTPEGETAAAAVLDQLASSLRTVAIVVGAVALVAAAVAYMAGRPAWMVRAYRRGGELVASTPTGSELDRRVAGNYDRLRVIGVVVAVAVVFLIGIGLVSIIVIGALLAGYLWLLAESNRRWERSDRESETQPSSRPR